VRTNILNKSLTPAAVDGEDGWMAPKKAPQRSVPAAQIRPDTRAALAPETIRANADRYFTDTERPLQQQVDRKTAQRDLVKLDLHRRQLEVQAAGGNPGLDKGVTDLQRHVAALDTDIASTTTVIESRRERARAVRAQAPELVGGYIEKATACLRAFAAVKPLYDALKAQADAVEATLRDSDPTTGRPTLAGVRVPNGSLFSLVHVLEPIFGLDRNTAGGGWLDRVMRDARDLGIEIEAPK
jgi:hypothetical protein